MGSIGSFGSFTQARLGIYAAMKGLTVTGNNISNISTPGYTRQVVDQVSLRTGGADRYQSKYGARVGNGALVTGISQIRDPYLDIRYRNEMSDVGYQDTKLAILNNLASVLDEVGSGDDENGIVYAQLSELAKSLIDLSNSAGQEQYERLTRVAAGNLCTLLNSYADKLQTQKEQTENMFRQDINDVNSILTGIRELNSAIRKSEIHGDDALEMRDERNRLIDDLSQYMKINVTYSYEDIGAGQKVEKLTITLGDANPDPGVETDEATLVDGVYCAQLATPKANTKGGAEAYEDENGNPTDDPMEAAQAFNDNYDIIISRLEDVKGRVKMVKDDQGNLVPSEQVDLDDNDLHGAFQAMREMLTEKGEFTSEKDLDVDESATTKRGIPYYQRSLDLLAQKIAEEFNDLNMQYAVKDGVYVGEDGKPVQLNGADITADHDLTTEELDVLAKQGKKVSLFSNHGDSDDMSGITAANISISQSWANGKVHVLLKVDQTIAGMEAIANGTATKPDDLDDTTQNDNVNHMITLIDKDLTFNPQDLYDKGANPPDPDLPISEYLFEGSFQEMLDHMMTTLGDDQRSTNIKLNASYGSSVELNTSRDSVSGVDLNDEAMNMMQYQKAYTAACRIMTAMDEALERLISNTGVAGR